MKISYHMVHMDCLIGLVPLFAWNDAERVTRIASDVTTGTFLMRRTLGSRAGGGNGRLPTRGANGHVNAADHETFAVHLPLCISFTTLRSSLPYTLTNMEQTYIMIKPDGVQRGLIAEVIKRFEQKGFHLRGMKIMNVSRSHAETHYSDLSDKYGSATTYAYFNIAVCEYKVDSHPLFVLSAV